MLKIAICDDELILRKALRKTIEFELSFHGMPYEIMEFDSGESLLAEESAAQLDILFLDIEMKRLSGMDTAYMLRGKSKQTVIIFVTSHPDYVFQGYEVAALNYILKPYREEKIVKVLHQALKKLDALKEEFYLIEQKSGSVKVPFSQLLYFQSERRQIITVTTETDYTFYGKLDMLMKELPDFFIRIHNRYLVNINYISELNATWVICNGAKLPVSRSYQQDTAISFAKKMLR